MGTFLIRFSTGVELAHDEPFPAHVQGLIEQGGASIVGPCDTDGDPVDGGPGKPAKKTTASRLSKRTQDAGGQSADDDPPTDAPSK